MTKQQWDDPEYQKRREQQTKRRAKLIDYGDLDSFDGLIALAYHGNAKPLCDHIRDHRLSVADRQMLAWLIEQTLQHGKKGRPLGAISRKLPGEFYEQARSAAAAVLQRQKKWRTDHKRKNVPAAVTDEMIADEIKKYPRLADSTAGYIRSLVRAPARISPKGQS